MVFLTTASGEPLFKPMEQKGDNSGNDHVDHSKKKQRFVDDKGTLPDPGGYCIL